MERFKRVQKWTGWYRVTYTNAGTNPDRGEVTKSIRGSTAWRASGNFLLSDQSAPLLAWHGSTTSELDVQFEDSWLVVFRDGRAPGRGRHKSWASSASNVKPASLSIEDGRYRLVFNAESEQGEHLFEMPGYGGGGGPRASNASVAIEVSGVLPVQGLRIRGSRALRVNEPRADNAPSGRRVAGEAFTPDDKITLSSPATSFMWSFDGRHPDGLPPAPKATVEWELAPVTDDMVLVLEAEPYNSWMPEAGTDERTPGNAIIVHARLQRPDGGVPADKARRIRFELMQVSREPGVALNWPPQSELVQPSSPDLRFDQDRNSEVMVTEDVLGNRAQTPDGEYLEAAVAVSAYDWGAFGKLRATADMRDGRQIVGYLKGHPGQQEVLLPRRQPNSRIADYWKEFYGLSGLRDESDGESDPVGDNTTGDGLTLYEEYRGFYEDRRHVRGHTGKKDIFIRDEIGGPGTRQGIAVFATATGLEVHYKLRKDEIGDDPRGCDHHGGTPCGRLINFNHQSAHLVDQHGLRITKSDPGFLGGQVVGDGPGTPKEIEKIEIHPKIASFFRGWSYATLLAHELCHSVDVWHHGEDDIGMVLWRAEDIRGVLGISEYKLDDDGDPIVNTRRSVRVYRHGEELPADHRNFLRGHKVWVAVKHGQHSGDSMCLMRYNCADALEGPTTDKPKRFLRLDEPAAGTHLCISPAGSLFGDADSNPTDGPSPRGTCEKQIRVSDF